MAVREKETRHSDEAYGSRDRNITLSSCLSVGPCLRRDKIREARKRGRREAVRREREGEKKKRWRQKEKEGGDGKRRREERRRTRQRGKAEKEKESYAERERVLQ